MMSLALTTIFVGLSACKKDNTDPSDEQSFVDLEFDHKWTNNWAPFSMNTEMNHPSGQQMTFTTLNYYISNVRLKKEDGTWWKAENSNYLIKVGENTSPKIRIEDVPIGKYTDIEYMIGVDSTRNVSGDQSGDLSPAQGMFWSWNTGYIFIKAEGSSPQSGAANETFSYHIGGFKNEFNQNATRINSHSFGSDLNVRSENNTAKVHFYVNAARFWHGGLQLSDMHTVHMPGQNAMTLADNFSEGFIVHHIH